MTDLDRGTDRAGRRAKRFLTPLQKYEIFLQLVRQEVTLAEAADDWKVDRSTIMRIRTVAKEGALEALANSRHRQLGSEIRTPQRGPEVLASVHAARRYDLRPRGDGESRRSPGSFGVSSPTPTSRPRTRRINPFLLCLLPIRQTRSSRG